MKKRPLKLQQLNDKMVSFAMLKKVAAPPTGWIKAIRTALGMSMDQLGSKLRITKQGVLDIEQREKNRSITIKALRQAGKAMDMDLVYGFVPAGGSLDALIEQKAIALATKIVMRTSASMKLEDQEVSKNRVEKAIRERAEEIKNEMPKILWD